MISKKSLVLISLGAALTALLVTGILSLGFWSPGRVKVSALPAESAAILTGRDEPGGLPSELLPGQKLDINTASLEELQLLPGIGDTLAQAILDYREENGPFESTEAIMEVPGIGQGRFETMADNITMGETK